MFLPLRTDAPLDHAPWATGGVIAANVLVHAGVQGAAETDLEPFILQHGEWAPWQWITSVFLHADWFHLLGNMLFLWVFGLVVEGKTGWVRFLAIYGLIAAASNAFEQTVMLGGEGGSLGASGVIYGLMAIAIVWAPDNEIDCQMTVVPFRRVEVSIRFFVGFYLVWQLCSAMLDSFGMGSALLHLIGAAAGFPIGVIMLRRGWVDCGGWDWFSRRAYRARVLGAEAPPSRRPNAAAGVRISPVRPARARFDEGVASGDVQGALRAHRECSDAERSTLSLSSRERLVRQLVAESRVADARPLIDGILRDDPGNPRVGLVEARVLLDESRPSPAARVLSAIAPRLEDGGQRRAHGDLVERLAALRRAGVMEFDD